MRPPPERLLPAAGPHANEVARADHGEGAALGASGGGGGPRARERWSAAPTEMAGAALAASAAAEAA